MSEDTFIIKKGNGVLHQFETVATVTGYDTVMGDLYKRRQNDPNGQYVVEKLFPEGPTMKPDEGPDKEFKKSSKNLDPKKD